MTLEEAANESVFKSPNPAHTSMSRKEEGIRLYTQYQMENLRNLGKPLHADFFWELCNQLDNKPNEDLPLFEL